MNTHFPTRALAIAALAFLPLSLTACAVNDTSVPATPLVDTSDESAEQGIFFTEAWAKAADGMSGVFGTIANNTSAEITLEAASSPRAGLVELHETAMVDGRMIMRELDGGFTIPAGDEYLLEPGGNHIMLMELDSELLPGELLPLTLMFSNGESVTLDLDVREFAGADEDYGDLEHHGGDGHEGHEGHDDHEDHEDPSDG